MPSLSSPTQHAVGPALSSSDFERIRRIAYERAGLSIPTGKEGMIRSRVSKRLRALRLETYGEYIDSVERDVNGAETVALIDLLTTNKTDFFREPAHFDFLVKQVLPGVSATGRPFRVWSAGCSSGEEPYTLAMVLREALPPRHDVRILATDICTNVVASARKGVYGAQQFAGVPARHQTRWFTPTPDGGGTVTPELRAPISFAHLNLMAQWPMSGPFDAIFCRNVMIYFDKPTITTLVARFHRLLAPGGHLFIGHSESLTSIDHPYKYVQPAVYVRA